MRKTKIICTIGPVTQAYDRLCEMADAGMNIARLNMSHGDHDTHRAVIDNIQQMNRQRRQPVAILMDTQGPEIRTGDLRSELELKAGDEITVSVRGSAPVEESSLQINYEDLLTSVDVGDRITVDNGLINLQVLEKNDRTLKCKVIDGGILKSKRHVNLPGIRVNLPAITEKDRRDILFAIENDLDFIALSFVREAADVAELRELLDRHHSKIRIIAKIEDQEGLRNIDSIIEAADAVMVARGDLGVEINIEDLPNVQRTIVQRCAVAGKPVIVATHLLESMIEHPIPTRAEVTDVANAVYEEVDAVMLSGETTIGKYPLRCIEYLDKVARSSEQHSGLRFCQGLRQDSAKQQLAVSAVQLADSLNARGMLVITRHGRMAAYACNARSMHTPVYAFTFSGRVQRQLNLYRGVYAWQLSARQDAETMISEAFATLQAAGQAASGDRFVVISDVIVDNDIDAIQLRTLP
ncbi:MAG TPA: pyruvate kinase [Pseudomonadales bacterium]